MMSKGTIEQFEDLGLINIQTLSPEILVDLKYATNDNFTGKTVYTDFREAYLVKDVAYRLSQVQKQLNELKPGFKLLIYDAARPYSIQKFFYELVKGTSQEQYVANPSTRSLHNYGVAVDLTIVDGNNTPLDMGTEFDYFGIEAHTDIEPQLLKEGKLTIQQIENRELLCTLMATQNFEVLKSEWWHFNGCSLEKAKELYPFLNF